MTALPAVLVAVAATLIAAAPAPAAPAPDPYRFDDAGGVRNVLPPGSAGVANAADAAAFLTTGRQPEHFGDQLRMYADLVYAVPGLRESDLDRFFKDASFGVKPGDVARTYAPRDDVTVVRDRGFGVPHVYGETRAGAMFGLGYVAAEDRLFLIDVLRHVGRAQLSSFVGGSRGNRALDRQQWEIAPYTEADLQRQVDDFDDLYGAEGAQIQRDIAHYVAGVNAYIAEAKINPTRMPVEYAAINRPQGPEPWKATDLVASASLVGGIFGKGGGDEVKSAKVLQAARARFGARRGTRVWQDFRNADDPEHDVTINGRRIAFQRPLGKRAPGSLALPDPGSVREQPVGPSIDAPSGGAAARGAPGYLANLGDALLAGDRSMSNALLVSGRESATGRPLAVFGPQTAYFSPQLLMEQDVHAPAGPSGPGIDARGAAFPGVNLYVQLGRGRDYAWSATSSSQDVIDVFAVDLCEPDGSTPTRDADHYRFRGACLPMETLERVNAWSPSLADDTPAGAETLRAQRTRMGLVTARGTIEGRPVAYTKLRSTYRHEIDSALGFSEINDPQRIRGYADFNRAMHKIGYTFHWFYADADDIAVFDSGASPVRAGRTSRDLPVRSRAKWEWRGWDPERHTAAYEPARRKPQAVNEPFLTNWNNGAAHGYRAADDQWQYGPVHRSETLTDRVRHGTRGDRTMTLVELVEAMENAGTVDVRGAYLVPWLLRALGRQDDPELRDAMAKLRAWHADGGHRRDLDRDGAYAHAEAIKLMDAWFPRLVEAQFRPVLGDRVYELIQEIVPIEVTPNDDGDRQGSHATNGWYSYVHKDLRSVLGRTVRGGFERPYCGRGDRRACAELLARTLREAIAVDAAELYRDPKCERPADQVCFDAVFHRPFGLVEQPLIHWINRPTFQQIVAFEQRLPR